MPPQLIVKRGGESKSQESKKNSQLDRTVSKHQRDADKEDRTVSRVKRKRLSISRAQKPHPMPSLSLSQDSDLSSSTTRRSKRSGAPSPEALPNLPLSQDPDVTAERSKRSGAPSLEVLPSMSLSQDSDVTVGRSRRSGAPSPEETCRPQQEANEASETYGHGKKPLYGGDRRRDYAARSNSKDSEATDESIAQDERKRKTLRLRRVYIANEAFQELHDVEMKAKAKELKMKALIKGLSEQLRKIQAEFQAYKRRQKRIDGVREIVALLGHASDMDFCIHLSMQEFMPNHPARKADAMQNLYQGIQKAQQEIGQAATLAKEIATKLNLEPYLPMADYFSALELIIDGEFKNAETKLGQIAQRKTSPESTVAAEILRIGVATYDLGRGFPRYRAFRDRQVMKEGAQALQKPQRPTR